MLNILLLFFFITGTFAVVPEDEIDSLPGIQFKINFKQYSGYLKPDNDTYFHYWLLESQHKPAEDPLVLWLNGGPGCSSMFGLLFENGPFTVTDIDNKLTENVYSWNKIANMLYIESPAWVGFSYTTNPNVVYSDDNTADLNYNALLDFLTKYSEYTNRSLYISGESYGGVYLPMLADRIIKNAQLKPFFKGVAIGNGFLSNPGQADSVVPLMYTHNLVGERLWQKLGEQCCINNNAMNCDYYKIINKKDWSNCYNWTLLISNMPTVVGLDPYNLYDTCYVDTSVQTRTRSVEYLTYLRKYGANIETIRSIARDNGISPVYYSSTDNSKPDCAYDGYQLYLQRSDVLEALHIPNFLPAWQDCNMTINEKLYDEQYVDQSEQLTEILNAKVPILCYNGDVDTVCNALGDQRFISKFVASLNRKQISDTVPWNYTDDTYVVAGWQTRYEGIDFLTVRGSGHYVPHDKSREALQMITNFIRNNSYTTATGIDVTPQPLLGSASKGEYFCGKIMFSCFLLLVGVYFKN